MKKRSTHNGVVFGRAGTGTGTGAMGLLAVCALLLTACADDGPLGLCSGPACAGDDVTFGGDTSDGATADAGDAGDHGDTTDPDVGAETATDAVVLPPDDAADAGPGDVGSDEAAELPDPDVGQDAAVDAGTPDVPDDPGPPDADPGECQTAADCDALYGTVGLEPCEQWIRSAAQTCTLGDVADDTVCLTGDDNGLCDSGACTFTCGDGFVQESVGEQCDDDNTVSGDGCRDDCIVEEPIGAGWTGGQCAADVDCAPAGSVCILGASGGSCSIPCTSTCADQAGAPVTFCIDADEYDDGMDTSLPAELSPALCVSKCDFDLFPRTGCRTGFHCELHNRHNQSVEDEVCVPGVWHVGLALSADGSQVVGIDPSAPEPAQPYLKLLDEQCSGTFGAVDATLMRAMADTLLAMGPDGRVNTWQRLCSVPSNLPDTAYDLHDQVASEQAFRLVGSRLEIVDWSAAGVYGGKNATGALVGGPLWPVRSMVYGGGSYYLYADAADDAPYAWYPERGRDFGMVNGDEWEPMDARLVPDGEYVVIKANSGGRFYRGWGRVDVTGYLADMAIDHLLTHGELLGIGDLSLPPGGDIDDHGSHELGRDADLYLITSDPVFAGMQLGAKPWLWVAQCSQPGGSWDCSYYENATGLNEQPGAPGHVPAATLLTTLAQYAYDNAGPTRFVQHDAEVLVPFVNLPGSSPQYVHAGNDAALGWPPHENHIHVRFPL